MGKKRMMTTAKLKPTPTPAIDEQGYYMLGEVNGNGWDVINSGVLGREKDGCEDASGTIYYTGDNWGSPQTMVIVGLAHGLLLST